MAHISQKEIKEMINQYINFIVFKYFYKRCTHHLNEIFVRTQGSGLSLRNNYQKPKLAFCKTSTVHSVLSFAESAF